MIVYEPGFMPAAEEKGLLISIEPLGEHADSTTASDIMSTSTAQIAIVETAFLDFLIISFCQKAVLLEQGNPFTTKVYYTSFLPLLQESALK